MTDTIRLSDRLELRDEPNGNLRLILAGFIDGEYRSGQIGGLFRDALIEACAPSRLILPPGVIHGSDGKFYAQGVVVRGLDVQEWTAHYGDGEQRAHSNSTAVPAGLYEVRPTTANPLPTLPDTCWQIPDGRICCLRRDAQALRDMGWAIHYTHGIAAVPPAKDDKSDGYILEARPPAEPDTEWVPWVSALREQLPLVHPDGPIRSFVARPDARPSNPSGVDLGPEDPDDNRCVAPNESAAVEVLAR